MIQANVEVHTARLVFTSMRSKQLTCKMLSVLPKIARCMQGTHAISLRQLFLTPYKW